MNYISSYRKVVLRADLRLTLDHSSRLEWCMCWECLSCTHHWANVPIVSFLPWWAWHSLQKQIWWCTLHRKRHMGRDINYKCINEKSKMSQRRCSQFWKLWYFFYLESRGTRCPLVASLSFISFWSVHALLPTRSWFTIWTLKYTQTGQCWEDTHPKLTCYYNDMFS